MIAVHVATHAETIFNCAQCPAKHCDESRPASVPLWELGDIKSRVCFKPMVQPWTNEVMAMYAHYKNGHLFFGNCLGDEPYMLSQAYLIIDNELADARGT